MTETVDHATVPAEAVRQVPCTLCWARSGTPCQRRPVADHLQRWLDAYSAEQVTKDDLGAVFGQVVVVTRWQVVPERGAA
jgi:hypothetical protein